MPATLLSTSSGGVQRPSRNLFDLRLGTHLLLGELISFFSRISKGKQEYGYQ